MVSVYVMCVMVMSVRYSIEKCANVSVYVMCVIVGVYSTVQRNVLWYQYM